MGSVYPRHQTLWFHFKNAAGAWKCQRSNYRVGQERAAKRALELIEARIAAGQVVAPDGPLTVARYIPGWLAERRALGVHDVDNDEARLRDHVLPALGALRLDEVRPRHLIDLFKKLRAKGALAPKTRYNVYSVVKALFRDAQIAELVDASPTVLTRLHLGDNEDADPEWRETAVYARAELAALLYDPRVPPDRRVWYGLEGLAGLRLGEAAGLRVRHYKRELAPLPGLTVAYSYARPRPKKGVRHMPVHPALAELLDAWLAGGWRALMGRDPTPDDLLVPVPPADAAARRDRAKRADPMRTKTYAFKRLRADLAALGLRHRRGHDLRRTLVSLARTDGARADLLERCTHNPTKKERSIDVYSTFEWAPLCAEVAKLRIGPELLATAEKDEGAGSLDSGSLPRATALATGTASAAEIPRPNEWRRRESKPAPAILAGLPPNPFAAFDVAISPADADSPGSAMTADGARSDTTCSNVASPVDALLATQSALWGWHDRALAAEALS
jgi:integrase